MSRPAKRSRGGKRGGGIPRAAAADATGAARVEASNSAAAKPPAAPRAAGEPAPSGARGASLGLRAPGVAAADAGADGGGASATGGSAAGNAPPTPSWYFGDGYTSAAAGASAQSTPTFRSAARATDNWRVAADGLPVEVLVHNVSHKDFFVSIDYDADSAVMAGAYLPASIDAGNGSRPVQSSAPAGAAAAAAGRGGEVKYKSDSELQPLPFGRPMFSQFQPVATAVGRAIGVTDDSDDAGAARPGGDKRAAGAVAQDDGDDKVGGFSLHASAGIITHPLENTDERVPVGLSVDPDDVDAAFKARGKPLEWDHMHWRDRRVVDPTRKPKINCVFFPLVAVILRMWFEASPELPRASGAPQSKGRRFLYLVSGSGTPRNPDHNVAGNSTAGAALLIKHFVQTVYPDVTVVSVPSGLGIFRFPHNVRFVNEQLLPLIDAHRSSLVKAYGDAWRRKLHVTLSMCHGTPARVAAISAGLRRYRPTYLHMWELKSFWYDARLSTNDVDVVEFTHVETRPSVSLDNESLDAGVRELAKQMRRYKDEFLRIAAKGPDAHELGTFWLRKSKKPVLSVLMVQRRGHDGRRKKPEFYRGMNMEVSMPTGSLCAERNVIGTALASDMTMKRDELRMVAVLSVDLKRAEERLLNRAPRAPAAAATTTAGATATAAEKDKYVVKRRRSLEGSDGGGGGAGPGAEPRAPPLPASPVRRGSAGSDATSPIALSLSPVRTGPVTTQLSPIRLVESSQYFRSSAVRRSSSIGGSSASGSPLPADERSDPGMRWRGENPEAGLNPIAPCGACNEWLKKIAEPNPDFLVVTFTDESCTSLFIKPVNED